MIKAKTDIDIDTGDRDKLLCLFKHNRASIKDNNGFKKHNTGVYFTDIPMNPIDNLSAIEYEEAEDRGYIKVDILNVSLYKDIKNEEHLNNLLEKNLERNKNKVLGYFDIVEKLQKFHDLDD